MSDSGFGSELTRQGPPTTLSAAALTAEALKNNRRRIRVLSTLTIGLWVINFLLVPAFWMPFSAKMHTEALDLRSESPVTLDTLNRAVQDTLLHISMVSGAILALITIISLLAAISTVWLVLTVRRVTLEQLSAGLRQISEQLQRLEKR